MTCWHTTACSSPMCSYCRNRLRQTRWLENSVRFWTRQAHEPRTLSRRVLQSGSLATVPRSRPRLNAPELRDGFFDRPELLDERKHAMLGVVELLGFLQHVGGMRARHHRHAVVISHDDVVGIHLHTRASDRDIYAGKTIVIDRSRWRDTHAEHGKLQASDLRRVANAGVHDGARETPDFHGCSHQPANPGGIGSIKIGRASCRERVENPVVVDVADKSR